MLSSSCPLLIFPGKPVPNRDSFSLYRSLQWTFVLASYLLQYFRSVLSPVSLLGAKCCITFLSNPVKLIPLWLALYKPGAFQVQAVNLCQGRTTQILVWWDDTNCKSTYKWPLPSCGSYKHVDTITSHGNFNPGCICCRFNVTRSKLHTNIQYLLSVSCPSLCIR